MHATLPLLEQSEFPALRRQPLTTLQVNLGYLCNQSCLHCHVNAGPTRKEVMTAETIEQVLGFLASSSVTTLDLTGGAPELNPRFRELVRSARALNIDVIDRCNLTIMQEPGQQGLADFLAAQGVQVVASLPCYTGDNVDGQRGKGVFERSIEALQALNGRGYGHPGSGLVLNLVYNPTGPFLPPPQQALEEEYRQRLKDDHGVVFSQLFTLANMPIARFGSTLISKGEFKRYMQLLKDSYNAETLSQVMCRSLISVDWRGYVYDCDFNQMLGLPLPSATPGKTHLTELMEVDLTGREVLVADHCYGCTAGQGSSCGGALE